MTYITCLSLHEFELSRKDIRLEDLANEEGLSVQEFEDNTGPLMGGAAVHVFNKDFYILRQADGRYFCLSETQGSRDPVKKYDDAVWRLYLDHYLFEAVDSADIGRSAVQSIYNRYLSREGFPDLGAEELKSGIENGSISTADKDVHVRFLSNIINLYETTKDNFVECDDEDLIDSLAGSDVDGSLKTVWAALNDYRSKVLTEGDPENDAKWKKIRSAMIDIADIVDDEPGFGPGFR